MGVNDQGKLLGQQVTDRTQQEIAREIKKLAPEEQIDAHYIALPDNKQLVVIAVPPGKSASYTYDGRAFQRNQSTTSRMTQYHYEQLLLDRGQADHAWEAQLLHTNTLDDLDVEEIYRTVADGVRERRIPGTAIKDDEKAILTRLRLMTKGKINNAALMLFGKEEALYLNHSALKMARFEGINKLGNFIDHQQCYGNAFKLLNDADAFLRRHLPITGSFVTNQFKRIDEVAIPTVAVREALINAICHRSYTHPTAAISLAIYDDRLEIWNYGGLSNQLKIEDLTQEHPSLPRNKRISNVFYIRGMIEAWGTGTNKIIDACKAMHLPLPVFSEYSGGFSIVFRFKFKQAIGNTQPHSTPLKLTQRQEALLALFDKQERMSLSDIMVQLPNPPSERMVRKDLTTLRSLGLIFLEGHAKTARWIRK